MRPSRPMPQQAYNASERHRIHNPLPRKSHRGDGYWSKPCTHGESPKRLVKTHGKSLTKDGKIGFDPYQQYRISGPTSKQSMMSPLHLSIPNAGPDQTTSLAALWYIPAPRINSPQQTGWVDLRNQRIKRYSGMGQNLVWCVYLGEFGIEEKVLRRNQRKNMWN